MNNIKIEEESYKNILIYYIRCAMVKDSKYVKIYSVNPLYLISETSVDTLKELIRISI